MAMSDTCVSPHFNHPEADIILRSSDGIDFHVFKLILTLASPFFEDMFRLPQPIAGTGDDANGDLPVIDMQEDSRALDIFLRFCYPSTLAEDPPLESLADIITALGTARKFSVDLIEKKVCQALVNPKLLEEDPFRCFAVARNARLKHETLTAARYTLRRPLVPSWFAEIDLITTSEFLALLTYHQRCGSAVASLVDLHWLREHYGGAGAGCKWFFGQDGTRTKTTGKCQCERNTSTTGKFKLWDNTPLAWWADYMRDAFIALRDCPSDVSIRAEAEKMIERVTDSGCSTCITLAKGPGDMQRFINLFALKVDEVTSLIKLEMEF